MVFLTLVSDFDEENHGTDGTDHEHGNVQRRPSSLDDLTLPTLSPKAGDNAVNVLDGITVLEVRLRIDDRHARRAGWAYREFSGRHRWNSWL